MPSMTEPNRVAQRSRSALLVAAAGLALSTSSRAFAQTDINWSSATSGNWIDPTKWSLNLYPDDGNPPGATYRAIFAAAGPAYTVTLNSDITISGLVLNSAGLTLAHTSGTLTLNGAADFTSGTYQLNGGTIQGGTLNFNGGGFSITNNSGNRFRAVAINGTVGMSTSGAQLRIADGLSFGAGSGIDMSASNSAKVIFENTQTINGGTVNFLSTGSFANVNAGATLTLSPTTTIRGGGVTFGNKTISGPNNSIINQGLISADRSGQSILITSDSFDNSGTLQAVNGGVLSVNNMPGGGGTGIAEALSGGFLNIGGLQGVTGTLRSIGAGSKLQVSGNNPYTIDTPAVVDGGTLVLAGSWINSAGIVANNATITFGGTFTTAAMGPLTRTGATIVNIDGNLDNTGATLISDSPATNYGLLGGTITGGTIATANGQRFAVSGTNSTLSGVSVPGDLTIASGTLHVRNGTAFSGDVAIGGGALEFLSGAVLSTGSYRFSGDGPGVLLVSSSGSSATMTIGPAAMVHGGGGRCLLAGPPPPSSIRGSSAPISPARQSP